MGYLHTYVSRHENDKNLVLDVELLVEWLIEQEIVKPRCDQPTRPLSERLRVGFDEGSHTKRLVDSDFVEPGYGSVGEHLGDASGRAFDGRLVIYNLPNPVPIPLATHNYPAYCPGCGELCDESFQESWFRSVEEAGTAEAFFEIGLPLEFEFTCDKCLTPATLGDLVAQGEVLHRRCFVEFYYSCYSTKNPEFLSADARRVFENAFQGKLAVRNGWTS